MSPRRKSLLVSERPAPTAEEVAARPELVKQMLATVSDKVYEHDLEHAVVVGFTTKGAPCVYHTYGRDLDMAEVARLFTDIAALARKEARKK